MYKYTYILGGSFFNPYTCIAKFPCIHEMMWAYIQDVG